MGAPLSAGPRGLLLPGQVRPVSPSLLAVPNGLIAYWGFDPDCLDFKSGLALDLSGNGNNGNLTGLSASSLVNGTVGTALYYDGSANWSVGVPSLYNSAFPVYGTLALWIYPTYIASGSRCNIFNEYTTNINIFYRFYYPQHSQLSFNSEQSLFFPNLILNCWNFVVAVWTQTNTQVYLNGTLIGTGVAVAITQQATFFTPSGGATYIQDECRIYNRGLDPWEVQQLYSAGLAGRRDAGNNAPMSASLRIMPVYSVKAIAGDPTEFAGGLKSPLAIAAETASQPRSLTTNLVASMASPAAKSLSPINSGAAVEGPLSPPINSGAALEGPLSPPIEFGRGLKSPLAIAAETASQPRSLTTNLVASLASAAAKSLSPIKSGAALENPLSPPIEFGLQFASHISATFTTAAGVVVKIRAPTEWWRVAASLGALTFTYAGGAFPLCAGTFVGDWVKNLPGANALAVQARFTSGPGGNFVAVYIQTSLDEGASALDVTTMKFTKVSADAAANVSAAQGAVPFAPSSQSLTPGALAGPVLGDRFRAVVTVFAPYDPPASLTLTGYAR